MKKTGKKFEGFSLPSPAAALLAALALAIVFSTPVAAEEGAGTLVFSLKFAGDKLEVESVSLVPGAPPDYKVQPNEGWLSIDLVGSRGSEKRMRVPDPRKLFLEAVDEGGIVGIHLQEGNPALVFAAPNLPAASKAEIYDEEGNKLLSLEYRKGLRLDTPTTFQPYAREFEPPGQARDYLPIAAFLGGAALVVAFIASRQSGNSPEEKHKKLEEKVDMMALEGEE